MPGPTNLTSEQVEDAIVLSFQAGTEVEVSAYYWFRRTPPTSVAFDPDNDNPLAVTTGTSYTDHDLELEQLYEYQVYGLVAMPEGGETSNWTPWIEVTTPTEVSSWSPWIEVST